MKLTAVNIELLDEILGDLKDRVAVTEALEPGDEFTYRMYHGVNNFKTQQLCSFLIGQATFNGAIEIPNTKGRSMTIRRLEFRFEERDQEKQIQICDLYVHGVLV